MSIRVPHATEAPYDLDTRRPVEPTGADDPAEEAGGHGRPAPGPAAFRAALADLGARLAWGWSGPGRATT
jgi:hypothetical protein